MTGILNLLGLVAPTVEKVLDRAVPDVNARAQAKEEINRALISVDDKIVTGQLQLNTIEAQSGSGFARGWRPFMGWASSVAWVYLIVVYPHLEWLADIYGIPKPPHLDDDAIYGLLYALLGLAGIRGYEKTKGVTR